MGSKASPAMTEGDRKTSENQQLVICSDTESALRALSRSSEPWVTAGSHSSGAVGCSASLILNPCSELGGGRQRHPQVLWAPTALPQGLRGCGDSAVLHTQPPPALLLPNDQQEPEEGVEEVWLCRRGAHHSDKTRGTRALVFTHSQKFGFLFLFFCHEIFLSGPPPCAPLQEQDLPPLSPSQVPL